MMVFCINKRCGPSDQVGLHPDDGATCHAWCSPGGYCASVSPGLPCERSAFFRNAKDCTCPDDHTPEKVAVGSRSEGYRCPEHLGNAEADAKVDSADPGRSILGRSIRGRSILGMDSAPPHQVAELAGSRCDLHLKWWIFKNYK